MKLEKFEDLLGQTLKEVKQIDNDAIHFILENGDDYKLYHSQDCCEYVCIDDLNGDLQDLVGSPITMAQESSNSENPKDPSDETYGAFQWTFYKIATAKGFVDIKWYGASNGYYSTSVNWGRVADRW